MTEVKRYKKPGRPKGKLSKQERNALTIGAVFPVTVANRIHEICDEKGLVRSDALRRIVELGLPIYEEELEADGQAA